MTLVLLHHTYWQWAVLHCIQSVTLVVLQPAHTHMGRHCVPDSLLERHVYCRFVAVMPGNGRVLNPKA